MPSINQTLRNLALIFDAYFMDDRITARKEGN